MEKKTRNILFVIVNVLLVGIVGAILGVCLPIMSNSALLLSYILLLVTLLCPIPIYFAIKNAASAIGIASILFMAINLITLIIFMAKVREIKTVGITEAAIVGTYLLVLLISIASISYEKNRQQ